MEIYLNVRYDGLDADAHQLNMRQLGQSMIGLDKALTVGLTALATGEIPGHRERPLIVVRARPPEAACVNIQAIVATAGGVLPYVLTAMQEKAPEIAWHYLSAMIKKACGKSKSAEENIATLIELNRENFRDRQNEREHVLAILDRVVPQARQIVAPVGRSCDSLRIEGPGGSATEVDVPMADAARSKEPLEVGDMAKFRIRVDGLIKHSRSLKVELPDNPGHFITAEVRDPLFDVAPNAYTRALEGDKILQVDAKPSYRENGDMVRLYILNATEG